MAAPTDTLEALVNSLDDLEDVLEPLLEKTLAQNLEALGPMEKVKMQTLVAYVIQDLVLIYLKTRGVDPATHPVSEELKRVKAYMDKIKLVENPPQRTTAIDKAAAGRFIKHGIYQAKRDNEAAIAKLTGTSSENQDTVVPFEKHIRFDQAKKQPRASGANDAESSSDEDDEVKVIDDAGEETPSRTVPPTKRRRAMDPFAGYTDAAPKKKSRKSDGKATPDIQPPQDS